MHKLIFAAVGTAFLMGSSVSIAADLDKGKKLFKKCAACHSLKAGKKKVGPTLYGIIGSKAAEMKGFKYSKAMRNSGLTWDDTTLDGYLANPRKFLKGNRMSFPGLKKQADRENVIAYIKENAK